MSFFGSGLKGIWSVVDGTAKAVASGIATGAQALGEVPVALTKVDNSLENKVQEAVDATEDFGASVGTGLKVDAVEWQAWMDKKIASLESAVGMPVDVSKISQDSDSRVRQAQAQRDKFLSDLEQAQKQHAAKVVEDERARLAGAEHLRSQIVAVGQSTAQMVHTDLDKVALIVFAEAAANIGKAASAAASIGKAFDSAKAYFCGLMGNPVQSCYPPTARDRLVAQIANAEKTINQAKQAGIPDNQLADLRSLVNAGYMALLSDDAYQDDTSSNKPPAPGWTRIDPESVGLKKSDLDPGPPSGFRAVVYEKQASSPPQYVLAFKGTDPTNFEDWENGLFQEKGINSTYYEQARMLASQIKLPPGSSLTFTGHSLGGGLASEAALFTNIPATTFNPQGLSQQTLQYDPGSANNLVTNYNVAGQALSSLQNDGAAVPSVGTQIQLSDPNQGDGSVAKHEMPAVMDSLTAKMASEESNLIPSMHSAAAAP